MLNGQAHLNLDFLADPPLATSEHDGLRLLTLDGCRHRLPLTTFASPFLQTLTYLDLSALPGSISALLQPAVLPRLRILKLRFRELDDAALAQLTKKFTYQLWSLDIAHNHLTDAACQILRDDCIAPTLLRSDAHFAVEGRVLFQAWGTTEHGPFHSVDESLWSVSFRHPDRYLTDAPAYVPEPDQGPDEFPVARSDGRWPIVRDSLDDALSSSAIFDLAFLDGGGGGLKHLHLSNNEISSFGIQKLIRTAFGHVEQLSCDSMPLLPPVSDVTKVWPKSAKLHGILGAGHLFRPVFSSNLRVLRIHHSLVTQVPTLELDGISALAKAYLAETSILARVEEAFGGQGFVPDANPRLMSLTLTCIPRRSAGPLIAKLVAFIRLLSLQEGDIQAAAAALAASPPSSASSSPPSRSWPPHAGLLQGLRHLSLEFEPDRMDDGLEAMGDWETADWAQTDRSSFSFFHPSAATSEGGKAPSRSGSAKEQLDSSSHRRRDTAGAASDPDDAYLGWHGRWNGKQFSLPVWIGPRAPSGSAVADDYRRLVLDHGLRHGLGPATPCQVLAGVPADAYVFQTAWCAALMPPTLPPPEPGRLAAMKDVVEELRRLRRHTHARFREEEKRARAGALPSVAPLGRPHFFWTGRLEVSTMGQP